jgi:hypothetical protein
MSDAAVDRRLKWYQATALFSVLFALVGFSYNVWRLEVTERNNNVRSASFELLLQLAELEQVVYAAHYDGDEVTGSPRRGWVQVGLINDLSVVGDQRLAQPAAQLRAVWEAHWSRMAGERTSADAIVQAIDVTRAAVREQLLTLE